MNSASIAKPKVQRSKKPAKKQSGSQNIPFGQLVEEYHDPKVAKLAIKLGVLAVGVFLLWASFSPVHEVVTGQGSVIPAGFVQQFHSLEGGVVKQVVVREGEIVQADAPLIVLEDVSVQADLVKAQARAEAVRLAIEGQGAGVQTSGSILNGSLKLRGVVDSQATASRVEDEFKQAQLKVVRAEIVSKELEAKGLGNQLAKSREEFSLIQRQLSDYDVALKSGAISRRERDTVARDAIRLESQVENLADQQRTTQSQIATMRAREEELSARFLQESATEVAELEVQFVEAQELIAQLSDRLARSTIRAAESGTVHNLAVHNPGQVLSPGELVVEVVPDSRNVFAEVDVPADKIGFVTAGTPASVKVLTYDFSRFGAIDGVISDVSPSSFKRDDGTLLYRVRIKLDEPFVGGENAGRQVLPGMSVSADIRLGEKSILSYLLKPLRAVSDKAFSEK